MLAVASTPVEMRPSHATGGTHDPNLLTALYRVSYRDGSLREMEIPGHHAPAMVDVHDIAGEKEVVHQGNDAPVRCPNGIARLTREVHTAVAA